MLFLLFTLNENPAMKETLANFLKFYRENRELIAMLTKNDATMSADPPSETPQEEKPRPLEGAANEKIFEELLSRLS